MTAALRLASRLAVTFALASLAACRLAPPHVRPPLPTPDTFPEEPDARLEAETGTPAPELGWRDFVSDRRLEALVAAAFEHNRDLDVAVARIEEARGLYRIQVAERYPPLDLTGDAARIRSADLAGPGTDGDAPPARTFDRYAIGVAVPGFELDFWGRVRSLAEAARSEFLATVEARRAFQLSLLRDVASAYLATLESAERIALAERTLESRREELEIARVRLESGITSELDFRQAESLLTQAETELASLRLALAQRDHLLALLVGGPASEELPAPLPLELQARAPVLAEGLPSELLTFRPDILAAEERLRSARASIGAARAAFFPSIRLTGDLGFASIELDGLFESGSRTWSFGPSIHLPIFHRGRLRGNLAATRAREAIELATYERTIQVAFREVADALAGRRLLAEQVAARERGVAAQRRIAELARIRYDEGVAEYLEVLDAERNLFAAEQELVAARRAQAENLFALYVALGGGVLDDPREVSVGTRPE